VDPLIRNQQGALGRPTAGRFHFTRKALDSTVVPRTRVYYYDSGLRGLALSITPRGRKVFWLYRKIQGRPERIRLGPYPDLSLEEARARANELNAAIARGDNPARQRRVVRSEMTLGELFQFYLEHYAKPRKKTWAEDVAIFRRYLNPWAGRKISTIHRLDVASLHGKVGRERGPYAANRLVALLCSMFNLARYQWEWQGANPAERIKKFPERARKRFLQPEEIPAFFAALAQEANTGIRDYVLLSLFTGARRANVLAMRWEDLELKQAIWSIPETKTGEAVEVVLSPEALQILQARNETATSEWVFPAASKSGHLCEPAKAWAKILQRANLKNLRLHDLRRTLGSWQAAAGASLVIIGRSLGHQRVETTAIYARLNLDPVRQSVNVASRALAEAGRLLPAGV